MSDAKTTLGELITTQKGFAFKSAWFIEEGRPIVKVKDFTSNSVDSTNLSHVSEEIAERYLRYELRTNDVVIQTVGSWPSNPASVVGKCVKIPRIASGALLNQNAVKISPSVKLKGGYLYYLLKAPAFGEYIVGTAQGAASQAAITLDSIRSYKFSLPPLPEQKRIAGILSAYDDLIENNLRRIKILEEMAQSLYREWFVHFRFPGHKSTPMQDSPLGKIPVGWEVKKLGEIINVTHGYAFKGKDFSKSPTTQILTTPGNFKIGGGFKYDKLKYYNEDATFKDSYILQPMDLILTMTDLSKAGDTLGYPAFVPKLKNLTFLHNQRVGRVHPVGESFPKHFLHCLFCDDRYRHHIVGGATGLAVKHTSPSRILSYVTALPKTRQAVDEFDGIAQPIFKLVGTLIESTENLRTTRDLLLPKLLTPPEG